MESNTVSIHEDIDSVSYRRLAEGLREEMVCFQPHGTRHRRVVRENVIDQSLKDILDKKASEMLSLDRCAKGSIFLYLLHENGRKFGFW